MKFVFHKIMAIVILFLFPSIATSADTYNAATNQLAIPSVLFAGTTYTSVSVTVGTVVSVAGGAAIGTHDTYDAATNQLTIPAVLAVGVTYTNVVITPGNILSVGGSAPPTPGIWGNSTWDQSTWQ